MVELVAAGRPHAGELVKEFNCLESTFAHLMENTPEVKNL
jgi:hypothetical protein